MEAHRLRRAFEYFVSPVSPRAPLFLSSCPAFQSVNHASCSFGFICYVFPFARFTACMMVLQTCTHTHAHFSFPTHRDDDAIDQLVGLFKVACEPVPLKKTHRLKDNSIIAVYTQLTAAKKLIVCFTVGIKDSVYFHARLHSFFCHHRT